MKKSYIFITVVIIISIITSNRLFAKNISDSFIDISEGDFNIQQTSDPKILITKKVK